MKKQKYTTEVITNYFNGFIEILTNHFDQLSDDEVNTLCHSAWEYFISFDREKKLGEKLNDILNELYWQDMVNDGDLWEILTSDIDAFDVDLLERGVLTPCKKWDSFKHPDILKALSGFDAIEFFYIACLLRY